MSGHEVIENCCTDKRQRHLCMGKRWLKTDIQTKVGETFMYGQEVAETVIKTLGGHTEVWTKPGQALISSCT